MCAGVMRYGIFLPGMHRLPLREAGIFCRVRWPFSSPPGRLHTELCKEVSMKQKLTHRILSLLLVVVMLFSLIPAAFAQSGHITATQQEAVKVAQGAQYQLELKNVFADGQGHSLTYSVTNDSANKSTTAIKDGVYYFTCPTEGEYTPTITARCGSDGTTADITLHITVTAGEITDSKQYDYDETPADKVTVYVTVSNDGIPLLGTDKDQTPLSHLQVTVPYFDLARYGLQDCYRYATQNGQGAYVGTEVIKRPTAMHLFIYLLERYYLGLPESECGTGSSRDQLFGDPLNMGVSNILGDANVYDEGHSPLKYTGSATSTYMQNFWGHDENLMYYRNHRYPLMSPGWGATADYMLLSDGDVMDVAMFSDWNFYTKGAFCCIGASGSKLPAETLTVKQGSALRFTGLKYGTQSVSDGGTDTFLTVGESDAITYVCFNQNWERVATATPVSETVDGNFELDTSKLAPGTYHLVGMEMDAGKSASLAPATCDLVVEGEEISHTDANDDGICDTCGKKFDRAPRLIEGVQDVKDQVVVGTAYLLSDLQSGKIFFDPDGDKLYITGSGAMGSSQANYFYQRSTDGGNTWSEELSFAGAMFGATTISLTENEPGVYNYRFYAKSYEYDKNGQIVKANSSADEGNYWNLELRVDLAENLDFNTTFYLGRDQNYSTNGGKYPIIKLYPSLGTDENGHAVADYDNPVPFLNSQFAADENAAQGYMDEKGTYNMQYATVKGGWYVYEGFGWNTETEAYDIPLGGMQIKLPADSNVDGAMAGGTNIYLRLLSVYASNKMIGGSYFGAEDYTARVTCPIMQCDATMGTPYVSGNYTYYPTLFYAGGNACLFNTYVYPTDTDSYIFNQAINGTLTAGNSVETKSLQISQIVELTVTVPERADFGLYFQFNNFNTSQQKPIVDWSSKDDGTKTAVYAVSKQNGNYTWRLTDTEEEYVTRGGWLNSLSSSTSMSFDFSSGNTDKLSHDFTKLGTQTIKRDEADLQVFVSPSGAKALGSGTERIRAYRMWELINSDAGNIMVEPDFVWNKLSGPAGISFVDDTAEITGNQVDSGNARHNWADISANGGTSIFAVRYDAMDMDTGNNKSHAGYYPATNPDRVAFAVVADELGSAVANVPFNGDFAANARLDGWDYIYDTWYYLRSDAQPALTFTTSDAVKVEYAFGLTDGKTMVSTVSDFSSLTAADGTYSIPLQAMNDSANNYGGTVIIRMTDSAGKYSYQLVKVAGIDVHVENISYPGEPVMPGSTVRVTFDGLYRSVNKISGIFNPTTFYPRYTLAGQEITGTTGQYQQMDSSSVTFTIPKDVSFEEGKDTTVITATNGYVFGSMYSAANPFGAMYNMTDVGVGTNFNAVMVTFAFQRLCDIDISVARMPITTVDFTVTGAADYRFILKDSDGVEQTAQNGVYSLGFGTYSYLVEADGCIRENGLFTVSSADNGRKSISVVLRPTDEATWDGKTVTEVQPGSDGVYEISTAAQLAWFAQQVNAGTGAKYKARLTRDISLNSYSWTPIGISSYKTFKGSFDGNGHMVTDLYINSTNNYQGLFGYISAASIKNLGVTGTVTAIDKSFIGGLVGYAAGAYSIDGCFNAAHVTGKQTVAGIVGSGAKTGTIKNCYNTGNITGTKLVAGINASASANSLAVAQNCFNVGAISGTANIGGINTGAADKATNSFYLKGCCAGAASAAAGTPKTAAEMADAAFAAQLGSAFAHVENRAYPVLTWQLHEHKLTKTEVKAATCTEAGNSEYYTCSGCGKYFSDAKGKNEIAKDSWVIAATGHNMTKTEAKAATCTEAGNSEYYTCGTCGKYFSDAEGKNAIEKDSWIIEATGHNMTKTEAKAATCTEAGNSEYYTCSACGKYFSDAEGKNEITKDSWIIEATGHKLTKTEAKAATCTEAGNSEYYTCSACGKYFSDAKGENEIAKDSWIIDALGHVEVKDAAKAATCTEKGLTEGSHCSRCNTVLKAQTETPALGHVEVKDAAKAATCTETGLTEGVHCSRCNTVLKAQTETPALGHVEVKDAAKAATCTETGLTEGVHCSRCNAVLKAQTETPALGHVEVKDAAKAATCTETGLTEGVHCSRCNAVLKAQTETPALGHDYKNGVCIRCGAKDPNYKPAAPTISTGFVASTGKPTVKWSTVSGAAKYEVYRADTRNGTYKLMGTVTGTSYTDESAYAGYIYFYKVRVVDAGGVKGNFSTILSGTCHCAMPVVSSGYVASTGKPTIKWTAVSGATEYQVYRADTRNGTYKLMGTVTGTSYTDESANAGYIYFYKVKAVSKVRSAADSNFSAVVSATCHCAKPVVKITTSGGDPKLTWNAVTNASKYEVYRATSKTGTYTKVATTTAKSYTDKTAKAGTTYYYKVKAVSKVRPSANSAFSAIKSIKAK